MSSFTIRRATPIDAHAMAAAHMHSIRSLGPAYYPPDLVERWASAVTPSIYINAMREGEVFFIAVKEAEGNVEVFGFSSHHPARKGDDLSVYVRGDVARHGLGTALLREAEAHALASGVTSVEIEASLAGAAFYRKNGFAETGRGDVTLLSGRTMPVVFMRKRLVDIRTSG